MLFEEYLLPSPLSIQDFFPDRMPCPSYHMKDGGNKADWHLSLAAVILYVFRQKIHGSSRQGKRSRGSCPARFLGLSGGRVLSGDDFVCGSWENIRSSAAHSVCL
jgi:hypothetical protein